MAQPIKCDDASHDALADSIISNLHDGQTLALCTDHLFEWCAVMAHVGDELAAGQTPTADTGPAAVIVATEAEANAADAEAEARLAAFPSPPEPSAVGNRRGRASSVPAEAPRGDVEYPEGSGVYWAPGTAHNPAPEPADGS